MLLEWKLDNDIILFFNYWLQLKNRDFFMNFCFQLNIVGFIKYREILKFNDLSILGESFIGVRIFFCIDFFMIGLRQRKE